MNAINQNPMAAIRRLARIEDKATGQFVDEIEFPINSTEVRRIQLAPSIVNDPSRFANAILDGGGKLPNEAETRKKLLADVANSEALETFIYQAQGGWTDPPGKDLRPPPWSDRRRDHKHNRGEPVLCYRRP